MKTLLLSAVWEGTGRWFVLNAQVIAALKVAPTSFSHVQVLWYLKIRMMPWACGAANSHAISRAPLVCSSISIY